MMIPLSVPSFQGKEWQYLKECLDTGWVSSAGKFVELFEQKIVEYTCAKHAVSCVNGTSALQVALRLAGVSPGDEVIVPTLTFIAPVNAIAYNGAKPIFMDADRYYNIDIEKTIEFINKKTVFKNGFTYNILSKSRVIAIIPVHVYGNAAWMDELIPLCEERNISVVEDASESLGSFYKQGNYRGKHTGTIGKLGCLSFNGNKIITTGGGGMILTNDKKVAEKARYLTTQARDDHLRYIHHEIGYNFRLSNIHAAIGLAQLEQLSGFLERKKEIYQQYQSALEGIEGLNLAGVPNYSYNNHWMNLLEINSDTLGEDWEGLFNRLEENAIQSRPVWALNHLQKPYKNCISYVIDNAFKLLKNSLCLPSSASLKDEEIAKINSKLYC